MKKVKKKLKSSPLHKAFATGEGRMKMEKELIDFLGLPRNTVFVSEEDDFPTASEARHVIDSDSKTRH